MNRSVLNGHRWPPGGNILVANPCKNPLLASHGKNPSDIYAMCHQSACKNHDV